MQLLTYVPLSADCAEFEVHNTTVGDLAELCIQWYPNHFTCVTPYDEKVALLELQGSPLNLLPALCTEVYMEACQYFGLSYQTFTCRKVRRPGLTLGGLHRQLWHEANMVRFDNQPELFLPYPNSDASA